MNANKFPSIVYAPETRQGAPGDETVVEYVGGPHAGERGQRKNAPDVIHTDHGTYRRSVRCADDGALRYVYEEDPAEIAHRRWIQHC